MLRALAIGEMLMPPFLTPFGVIVLFSCNWVLNEADTFKASSILIYLNTDQSIYTQEAD
jgi:hypothetical protein